MQPISFEQSVFTFIIGEPYKDTNGLSLNSPAPISRILIEINWKSEINSAFIPIVGYYDRNGNMKEIAYPGLTPYSFLLPIRLANKRDIENNSFKCSYVAFRLSDTGIKVDSKHDPVIFNPVVHRLEDNDREWIVALDEE
jgi:hypothetical protein